MVQIKVKGLKEAYHIIATYDDSECFFQTLEERLKSCQRSHDGYFEAFFHVALRNSSDFIRLLEITQACHTLIRGMNYETKTIPTRIIEYDLHGGETYHFHEPVLLLGNIHQSAYVSTHASIYVLGKVQGNIDLLHEDCVLCASMLNANIRICDSIYQNMTSFSPSKVYYEQRNLEMKKYKEVSQWEKL